MTKGILINDIELAFAPMSAYHFGLLIRDREFHDNFLDSHLYVIAQRKELTFHNFKLSKNLTLNFEIRQADNPVVVDCLLPIIQKNITENLDKHIQLRLHDRRNKADKKIEYPFNGAQGFSIHEVDPLTNESKSLAWFSPDKLLQNSWKRRIMFGFSGSVSKFLEYQVHYVGKSTEQNICKRLSKHSTFQEILTNQEPFAYGNIPSNEIMILFLRIKDNNSFVKWGKDSTGQEISDFITNYVLPSDKTISLDAEKALIKHLQPAYNRVLYGSFPNEKDLINQDFHDVILYGITDPITLIYKNGKIRGAKDENERDYIEVERLTN